MSLQSRLAMLTSSVGADVKDLQHRLLAQEQKSLDFYEEYVSPSFTLSGGWQLIGSLNPGNPYVNKTSAFSGIFYGQVPYSGTYKYTISAQCGAVTGSSGSRFMLCSSSATLGGGTRYAMAEMDPTARTEVPTLNLSGMKYLLAGSSIYFSFYSSGVVVGKNPGPVHCSIQLVEAYT